jgi:AcrR family transcriptional regulator
VADLVQDRQDAKRRAVLDAAAALYANQGYRATSMNDLAAAVGLSKPSLYHYVRNKEEILVELYEDVMRDNTAAVEAIQAHTTRAIDALRQIIVQRVAYTCENQALLRVFFEEEAGLPHDRLANLLQRRRAYEDAVMAVTRRAVAEGSLSLSVSPRIYVNTLLGAANWVYKWFAPDGRLGPRELGEEVASVLLPPPTPVP